MKIMLKQREGNLLLAVGVILLVLWLLGLGTGYTLGGLIYLVLLVGILFIVVPLMTRYRTRRR